MSSSVSRDSSSTAATPDAPTQAVIAAPAAMPATLQSSPEGPATAAADHTPAPASISTADAKTTVTTAPAEAPSAAPAAPAAATPSAAPAAAAASPALSPGLNAAPQLVDPEFNDDLPPLEDPELDALRDEIYDLIRHIHDPEHPYSLEKLGVVYKSGLTVAKEKPAPGTDGPTHEHVHVEFKPTVPHCSLATLIGLCIRTKVTQAIPQLKERAAAAMENPALRETVERLIKDQRSYD